MEGQVEDGLLVLRALRARYAGTRRNPYNEIECGDHYARSLAGWSMLDAMSGFRYNAIDGTLRFAPVTMEGEFRVPFITADGWGRYKQTGHHPWSRIVLSCSYGTIRVQHLILPPTPTGSLVLTVDGRSVAVTVAPQEDGVRVTFDGTLILPAGSQLEISVQPFG